MMPSLSESTLFVPDSACRDQSANCPLPIPGMWRPSESQSRFADQDSDLFPATSWDPTMEPLRLQGQGQLIMDRIQLDQPGQSGFIDFHGVALADNFTVPFPGGAMYTLDVGFFSLYAQEGDRTINWPSGTTGDEIELNRTLPGAFEAGLIPSMSYGLHIGSARPNISGSLQLGGFDSSRCITPPIVTDNRTLTLTNITLEVAEGAERYFGLDEPQSLLDGNGQGAASIEVMPNPGVPYMYLPRITCDAITRHLPVRYNPVFNLYTWNTQSRTFRDLTSSPHHMRFSFNGQNIDVPFALLNLTLESPLTATPTPYFPCSPYEPPDDEEPVYHLGRAFLQAAFLAQNWQSNRLWLAQAPGPDFPPPSVKTLMPDDDTLAGMTNPPTWLDTWRSMLTPLPERNGGGDGLSIGAKIAIGVCAGMGGIALLGLFYFVFRRMRRMRKQERAEEDGAPRKSTSEKEEDDERRGGGITGFFRRRRKSSSASSDQQPFSRGDKYIPSEAISRPQKQPPQRPARPVTTDLRGSDGSDLSGFVFGLEPIDSTRNKETRI
ncbi:aspartic peptidase domain-containing protein [Lineolata rhizophorae]|uniref:Aspartic peptidase domain-containing protein n=1 Tax=Lineolata rhizophorae TaxID=578093 RepID=A0A6A6PD85_9PEZI|nr:aspartic peptidase domain-containing protein [Lineolata rhizophorae]